MTRVIYIISVLLIRSVVMYSQDRSFVYFDVRPADNQKALIQWNVNPAGDTFSFELQKSNDLTNWKVIAYFSPDLLHQYSYTDSLQNGVLYYRVRQIKADKSLLYSQIRWVQVNKTGKLYIWPSPAKNLLHLKTSFNSGSIDVVDESGRYVFKIFITGYITDISIARLAKGIYFLQVKHGDEILKEKFIKE
jgi:hypothetical protein